MNQSVSSNPPFFLRLLSPFVCSCGPIKGSRIGFAKFFRRNTTPLRVWRFPRNPLGLETLPFQFAFYLCHRNNQTSGELPFPLFAGCERTSGQIEDVRWSEQMFRLSDGVIRKSNQNRADENKKSAVPTCNTECPCGFQFASEDSRFLSSADSRACHIALSVSCTPTRLYDLPDDINAFTTVVCFFR